MSTLYGREGGGWGGGEQHRAARERRERGADVRLGHACGARARRAPPAAQHRAPRHEQRGARGGARGRARRERCERAVRGGAGERLHDVSS